MDNLVFDAGFELVVLKVVLRFFFLVFGWQGCEDENDVGDTW